MVELISAIKWQFGAELRNYENAKAGRIGESIRMARCPIRFALCVHASLPFIEHVGPPLLPFAPIFGPAGFGILAFCAPYQF